MCRPPNFVELVLCSEMLGYVCERCKDDELDEIPELIYLVRLRDKRHCSDDGRQGDVAQNQEMHCLVS